MTNTHHQTKGLENDFVDDGVGHDGHEQHFFPALERICCKLFEREREEKIFPFADRIYDFMLFCYSCIAQKLMLAKTKEFFLSL